MLRDVLFALRSFKRSPGFTFMAVAALAICIGANAAIFSIVNAVLLRPLNFPGQQELVSLYEGIPRLGWTASPFSCPDYLFVAAHNRSFESIASYHDEQYEVSQHGSPQRVQGARVSASLFRTLEVYPQLGRVFTVAEDEQAVPVAVISDGFWRRSFGGRADVIGQTIDINRKPYKIVGVMLRSFLFPLQGPRFNDTPADVFIPVSWTKQEREGYGMMFNDGVIARLKPGVSVAQASEEVNALLHEWGRREPAKALNSAELTGSAISYREDVVGPVETALVVLLAAVALVLLIGCADVANLLLARVTPRQREFAIRAAVGANRVRLVRQSLSESLLLSVLGGGAGIVLALWLTPTLVHYAPVQIAQLQNTGLDWRVALFVVGIVLFAPVLFGLAPAMDAARQNIADRLREGGRSGMQSRKQRSLMSVAVVAQFALALVLLVGAGLLIRSYIRITQSDPGFRPQHVLAMAVDPPRASYSSAASIVSFYQNLLHSIRQLPGIAETGAISALPMDYTDHTSFTVDDKPLTEMAHQTVFVSFVAGNALSTLRASLKEGRLLTDRDTMTSPRVAVIDETLAHRIWPHQDPIGHSVRIEGQTYRVVGVVGDIRQSLATTEHEIRAYVPEAQIDKAFLESPIIDMRGMYLLIRSNGDPGQLASALRKIVRQIDPSLPVADVETLDQYLNKSLVRQRFQTFLLAAFAGAALLLAVLGIAGVLSYAVAQRTAELGIRMALGAQQADVLKLILREGLRLVWLGMAMGLAASLFAARLLASLLYDTSTYDLATFTGVSVFLTAIGVAAALLPAYRATRIDPVVALRVE